MMHLASKIFAGIGILIGLFLTFRYGAELVDIIQAGGEVKIRAIRALQGR